MSKLSFILFIVLIVFGGCESNKPNIIEPELAEMQQEYHDQDLTFISLNPDHLDLTKPAEPITISTTVTRKDGGQLLRIIDGSNRVDEKYEDMQGRVTLDFPQGAVDKPETVSFTLMRGFFMGFVELEYAPHGLLFNRPAILNIRGRNLDLSALDPDRLDEIKLYYTSQKNGKWIEMNCSDIFIDIDAGIFRVIDGELPHFSRYAVAYSN